MWYAKSISQIEKELDTDIKNGLSIKEVQKRMQQFGLNQLKEFKKINPVVVFLNQFKDFMIIILIIASIISFLLGEHIDSIIILIILILNAIIGFIQEYRAEKSLEALKKLSIPYANVIREKEIFRIPSIEIVPGDIVILEAGDIVPADIRIIESYNLQVNESILTGESVPVDKNNKVLNSTKIPIQEQSNTLFKNTQITNGKAKGIVISTGMNTEIGKIASLLQQEEKDITPLQKRLERFGKKLTIIILFLCVIFFLIGFLKGEDFITIILTSISLAVAAIPESLPAVITISLALGATKMIKQNALIRKLKSIETLGSVTYICSDKTGTLTLNQMQVEKIWIWNQVFTEIQHNNTCINHLIKAFILCNNAYLDEQKRIGDPTELALLEFAYKNYHSKFHFTEYKEIYEIPFDSTKKYMSKIYQYQKKYVCYTKGAFDIIIKQCRYIQINDQIIELQKDYIDKLNEVNNQFATRGYRILGICYNEWDTIDLNTLEHRINKNMIFLGLAILLDPPRKEAEESVRLCKQAGIIPVMITGDHPVTAKAIAKRIGIIESDEEAVISGKELDEFTDEELQKNVIRTRVYARVSPEHKLKIIKALKENNQIVAMTGDGVNDAPALKFADIGIAMGINGTEVSKEASDMILLDDNFATIVKAVKEGRRIYDNIKKFIKYTLTSNLGEIVTILLAPLLGLPIPLLPIHILWINLVTDGLPGLALSEEIAEKNIMKRKPRDPQESIFSEGLSIHILLIGFSMGIITIISQYLSLQIPTFQEKWQTIAFTVLCFSQLGHALAIRSDQESLFTIGFFTNKLMVFAFFISVIVQILIIYVPYMNYIFKTKPLSIEELAITILFSCIIFLIVEIEKLLKRKND